MPLKQRLSQVQIACRNRRTENNRSPAFRRSDLVRLPRRSATHASRPAPFQIPFPICTLWRPIPARALASLLLRGFVALHTEPSSDGRREQCTKGNSGADVATISRGRRTSIARLESANNSTSRRLTHRPLSHMSPRPTLPARYPPIGIWPAVMRADMAAAYLDYRNTTEFARAVTRGEAPPPIGYHGTGRSREPVWSKAAIDNLTWPVKATRLDKLENEDLVSLV